MLRHGQSQWNLENRFTGWVDVDLSPRGIEEAQIAGKALKDNDYQFDVALTSVLKRSIHTLEHVLRGLDQTDIPIHKDWHLNERHYGGLQGLNKSEMTQRHGEEQVLKWRRGYAVRPPEMSQSEVEAQHDSPQYQHLDSVPATESLADTYERVVRYWEHSVAPELHENKKILIVAHGNSLRALVKYLDGISDEDITSLNIPTGIPLVYLLNDELKPIEHFYLADSNVLEQAVSEVKKQSSSGKK